jgi:hypothetical protein
MTPVRRWRLRIACDEHPIDGRARVNGDDAAAHAEGNEIGRALIPGADDYAADDRRGSRALGLATPRSARSRARISNRR